MAPRSMASVKLSFGLVTIPVNVYTSSESSAKVSFNWLHKKCGHRLKQQYYCPDDNVVVEADEKIKGYEFQKGEYVCFTKEELKVLEAKSTATIDIEEFVPQDSVDPLYFEKLYYLGPDKGGDKAYQLLVEALKKKKRVAIARYNARGKQYLVAIRPKEKGLVMEQLHYHDELKPYKDIPKGKANYKKSELDLALKLIDQASTKKFDPTRYEDEVKKKTLETIQRKIDGEDITKGSQLPEHKVMDLLEALQASLKEPSKKKKSKKGKVA